MSAHLKELGLNGFASWTKIQAKEEVEHGLKIFDYLINCNSFVTLKQIRMPEFEFNGILSIFNRIYEHEQCITNAVMAIAQKAEEENDRSTLNFIDWFIAEQIEEEENIKNIIKRLELFGEDKVALYLMDKELGERSN
jgi:ferritin